MFLFGFQSLNAAFDVVSGPNWTSFSAWEARASVLLPFGSKNDVFRVSPCARATRLVGSRVFKQDLVVYGVWVYTAFSNLFFCYKGVKYWRAPRRRP